MRKWTEAVSRKSSDWALGEGSSQTGRSVSGTGSPAKWSQHQMCQRSSSISTALGGFVSDLSVHWQNHNIPKYLSSPPNIKNLLTGQNPQTSLQTIPLL